MLFNVVNEKDPRIRITILRPSGIAAMTGSAAPQTTDSFAATPNSSACATSRPERLQQSSRVGRTIRPADDTDRAT